MEQTPADNEFVEVPKELLSQEALRGLMEEFILREGTDYGHSEAGIDEKIERLSRQMNKGQLIIAFSLKAESCTLLTKEEFRKKEALAENTRSDVEYDEGP